LNRLRALEVARCAFLVERRAEQAARGETRRPDVLDALVERTTGLGATVVDHPAPGACALFGGQQQFGFGFLHADIGGGLETTEVVVTTERHVSAPCGRRALGRLPSAPRSPRRSSPG